MKFSLAIPKQLQQLAAHSVGRHMLLSAMVGLIAGLGALAFFFGTHYVDHLVLEGWAGFHPPLDEPTATVTSLAVNHRWFLFLLPALGGLISGYLVFTFAPEAEGHGTDAAIDAFHNRGGTIRTRVPWIKALASVATIGTGGSAGREGPIAQIGAGFGSFLAIRLGLPPRDRRLLLLAGIAAGIGATFRAPLAGALFAVEVLYREPEFEHEALIPCIISSIVAYSLFGAVTGWEPVLKTPLFVFQHPAELPLYFLLALACAYFGGVYTRTFYSFRDFFRSLPLPAPLKPAIGGLLVGLLAMAVPQVLGPGYSWVQAALYGKMALSVMLVVALAKIVATCLTIPSGGSGGVFAPSLVIGALLGGSFGAIAEQLFPVLVQDPRAYVLVGMAGFFAGVSNTPIATLIMVSELTGNYGLLAPLMLVCVVAMITARRTSIYEKQVSRRIDSPAHLGDLVIDVLQGIQVGDLAEMGHRPQVIPEDMPLSEIVRRIAVTEGAYFPVVDAEGRMQGILSVRDVRRILNEDIPAGLVVARDFAVSQVVTSRPEENLNQALRKLVSNELEEIPVVDPLDSRKILFMLPRRALLACYAKELERQRGLAVES